MQKFVALIIPFCLPLPSFLARHINKTLAKIQVLISLKNLWIFVFDAGPESRFNGHRAVPSDRSTKPRAVIAATFDGAVGR